MISRNDFSEGRRRAALTLGAICALPTAVVLWVLERPTFADGAWLTIAPWNRVFEIAFYALVAFWAGNASTVGVTWILEGFLYGPATPKE